MTSRILSAVADTGPVVVLASIAAAGSFTHIRDTAHEHGQRGWMAWAIAVCIDLTCVMAARERQRDQRTGRRTGPVSWPGVVLAGGILLSLAANLAQAEPTVWGWVTAGTPAAAFLVAVSMLERRTAPAAEPTDRTAATAESATLVPPSFGNPSPVDASSGSSPVPSSVPPVQDGPRPQISAVPDRAEVQDDERTQIPVPSGPDSPSEGIPGPLVEFARRIATEHQATHGRPITRDALRARLGVSNQLASDLLRQIRTTDTATESA